MGYHLQCSWRPQPSGKVEKSNDIIKRHLHKLTEEAQDNWVKVLPRSLMRARTTPQKQGLPPFECIYGRPFLCKDIFRDHRALELTSYVTQLSAFQKAIIELWEMTPDPSKPLFEPGTEVLIKTLWSWCPSLKPLWLGPYQVIFFIFPQLSKCQELIHGYMTHKLRAGTLTRTKWPQFMSLLSVLWLCTFQMGLIIYVSLLLLTPKILSLSFDPQGNAFLSWAQSYAEFHSQTAGSLGHSPLHHRKASLAGHFKEKMFSKFVNTFDSNHMWCLLNWWHLSILRWTDVTMDIT